MCEHPSFLPLPQPPGPRESPRERDEEVQKPRTMEGHPVWVGDAGAPVPDEGSGASAQPSDGEVDPTTASLRED
ncbi:hypothetical protein chiPu_0033079, partial [Chiloscyllium punctatum]|nr:hypothetical protein [Chiloscyllium punctatum]